MKSHFLSLLLILTSTLAAAEPVSTGLFTDTAIGGMDSVAYHDKEARRLHRHTEGNTLFVVKWNNAYWYFASQQSADRFRSDPERYRPEYNGHCANALSLGEGLIPTDGRIWEFFGDQLHLFFAERGRQRWLKGDWQRYKREADAAWDDLKNSN